VRAVNVLTVVLVALLLVAVIALGLVWFVGGFC